MEPKMSNSQMVKHFLHVSKIEKNLTFRTISAYNGDLKNFLLFLGDRKLTEVKKEDIHQYIAVLENNNLKGSSIRRKLATLKVFFNHLEETNILKLSPTKSITKKYRISKRLPKVMSSQEIEKLLQTTYHRVQDAIDNKLKSKLLKRLRDRAILELLFAIGIRIDELIKLDIDDIDFYRRTVLIFGKGRKERLLYLFSDQVILAIKQYLYTRTRYVYNTNAVFINRYGRRLSVHSIGNIFSEYCNLAGIEKKYTPHCLRHSMATMLIENGADIRSVQEILGHSSISTTEIYLSVSQRRKQEVLSKFSQRNNMKIYDH